MRAGSRLLHASCGLLASGLVLGAASTCRADPTWVDWPVPYVAPIASFVDTTADDLVAFDGMKLYHLDLGRPESWGSEDASGLPGASTTPLSAVGDPLRREFLVVSTPDWSGTPLTVSRLELAPAAHWSAVASDPGAPFYAGSKTLALDPDLSRVFCIASMSSVLQGLAPELFALDLSNAPNWQALGPLPTAASDRILLAFDSNRRRVLALDSQVGTLWARDSTDGSWSVESSDPRLVGEGSLTFDASTDRAYARASGSLLMVREFSGPAGWRELVPAGYGPESATLTVDGPRSRLLNVSAGEVWAVPALDATPAWTLESSPTPPALMRAAAVWDAPDSELVVIGGLADGASPRSEVYAFRPASGTWRTLAPDGALPPRYGHTAWCDETGRAVYVFGGTDGSVVFNDLWRLDLSAEPPTWSRVTVQGGPPAARWNHRMVWDSRRKRLLVCGGLTSGPAGEIWSLDPNTSPPIWTLVPVDEDLLGRRQGFAATYDVRGDRLLVTGGPGIDVCQTNTLALELSTGPASWQGLAAQAPWVANECGAFFDPGSCSSWLVDGMECFREISHAVLSRYDLQQAGTFADVYQGGAVPMDRVGHAEAFDEAGRRYFMVGGSTVRSGGPGAGIYTPLHDVAMLVLDPLASYGVGAAVITRDSLRAALKWSVTRSAEGVDPGGGPQDAIVERAVDSDTSWVDLTRVVAASESLLTAVDSTLAEGHRYGYRLRWYECARVVHGPASGVAIPPHVPPPTALAIAFAPGSSNPSAGDVVLTCRIPGAAPARLEIVDLRGRTLLRRWVAPGASGIVPVPIARADLPGAGVYFVRIALGAESARLRLVRIAD